MFAKDIELNVAERQALLFPELVKAPESLAPKMTESNSLTAASTEVWRGVAQNVYFDKTKKVLAPLNALCKNVLKEPISAPPGVIPKAYVEVINSAGDVLTDATDWQTSAISNTYVGVDLHRKSRPFGITVDDVQHGERIETKLGAAINTVAQGVFAAFAATIATVKPTAAGAPAGGKCGRIDTTLAAFSPEYIAQTLSPLFGDAGQVDSLLLHPSAFASVVPTNALSLGHEPGTYGVGEIFNTSGLTDILATILGVAMRQDAVVMAAGVPALDGVPGLAVRYLGEIAGIPMVLKSWTQSGTETIWSSVETLAGFSIVNPNSIYLVNKSA